MYVCWFVCLFSPSPSRSLAHPPTRNKTPFFYDAGDGKCVICDSHVRPATLVRVCDECNYGSYAGRCVVCGGIGVADANYCKECTIQEKDVRLLLFVYFRYFNSAEFNSIILTQPMDTCREMDVQRLLIWAVHEQICIMIGRGMVGSDNTR